MGQTSGFMARDIHAFIADAGANLLCRGNVPIDSIESGELNPSGRFQPESSSKSSEVESQISGKEILTKAWERSKKRNATALGTPNVSGGTKLTSLLMFLVLVESEYQLLFKCIPFPFLFFLKKKFKLIKASGE